MKTYIANEVSIVAARIIETLPWLASDHLVSLGEGVVADHVLRQEQCGTHTPKAGDYVVFGANNDTYLCPQAVFEAKYHEAPTARSGAPMDFGKAVEALKAGGKVARAGWNGKGMFLFLVRGSTITVDPRRPLASVFPPDSTVDYLPHIDMKTADDKVVPWLASQTDVLAEDWQVVW